jgi:3-dehydroquinate synthase
MTETIRIELGARSYDVHVGPGALATGLKRLQGGKRRFALVIDENVLACQSDRISQMCLALDIVGDPVIIPAGEGAKSFRQLEELSSALLSMELERGDAIIAVGGGVTGDLAGFAAAIYKRGIDVIQVPTTLLSMVDSSVGGKTAINTSQGKNLIGVFHQPARVIADTGFLETLPRREILAGYAEILKAALIGDADLFKQLETAGANSISAGRIPELIAGAVRFKASIVAADEREAGSRALLNLGHTFGHALESEADGKLLHGEAVAAGLALAFDYSVRQNLCPAEDATKVKRHLDDIGLEYGLPRLRGAPFTAKAMLDRMRHDKKTSGGHIRLILARGIGDAFIHDQTDMSDLLTFLKDKIQ